MKFVLICIAEEDESAHVTHVTDSGSGYGQLVENGSVVEIDFNVGDSIDICHEGETRIIAG